MRKCKYCKKGSAVKSGIRKNKVRWVQRYYCKGCDRTFVDRKGFENFRHKPEVITAALDLRAKGLSLSDVADHLDQHHGVDVTRQTVSDWQKKFGKKIDKFTKKQKPKIDGDVHADEVFLRTSGEWTYFWDAMDYVTKFIVGDHFSDERAEEEAEVFLTNVKKTTEDQIWRIHTDNSHDYFPTIKKVFGKGVDHKHDASWKRNFKNNPIERFHNSLKQRYKVMRGFCTPEGAESFLTFWKNYYNFVRKHMSLGDKTPAQAAGIELDLGRNRFRGLIEALFAFNKARIWQKPNMSCL